MQNFHGHTTQITARRRWTTTLTTLASACLVMLPPGLDAHDLTPPPVPAGLEVPAGHRPFLLGHAVGTQNYICLFPGSDSPWGFVGPQATLFNDDGQQIMTHFLSPNPEEGGIARPTWQHARDTSTVWAAALVGSSDPNFVEPGAIPWLLLLVVGADFGPTGGDCLTATTYMHRVHTSGGLAPATGCAEAMDVGARVFVPYSADYIFYKATGRE
jgi:Protein of unknown function (DUF3455)